MAVADGGRGVSVGGGGVAVGGGGLSVAARATGAVVAGTVAVGGSVAPQPVVKSAMSRISANNLVDTDLFIDPSSHY
jgi:hypothetical protein